MSEISGSTTVGQGPKKQKMISVFLRPAVIIKENLNLAIEAGWLTKETVCRA